MPIALWISIGGKVFIQGCIDKRFKTATTFPVHIATLILAMNTQRWAWTIIILHDDQPNLILQNFCVRLWCRSNKCCFALLTAKLQLKALLCIKFFLAYLALDLCSLFTPFRFHLYFPTLLVTLISRDALTANGCCVMLWRRLSAEVLCDVGAYFSPVERHWEPLCGCWEVATLQLLVVRAPSHPFPPGS